MDRPALLAEPLGGAPVLSVRARRGAGRERLGRRTGLRAEAGIDSATDTPGIEPDNYACGEPGYINFEGLPNHYDLSSSSIGGVQFTTTNGYTWEVGDFGSGEYNGKYPSGDYTSEGSNWAWLGPDEGSGRVDFVNGPASYFSLLTSASTTVELEAYDSSGELLATAGPMTSNIDTGLMDELRVTRSSPDIADVIVHDDGNYFLVDSICTDAPGTYTTPIGGAVGDQMGGNPSINQVQCEYGKYPVNCASGDFWHTFTDVSIPGRGIPLSLTRTYNSALAAEDGPFGHGWSANMTMSASIEGGQVTIHQEDGTTVTFTAAESEYTAPPRVLATLVKNEDGTYTFTRRADDRYTFSEGGQLIEESERNGNTTTFAYNGSGQLTAEVDPAGRKITVVYGGDGRIASATDPEGRETNYDYDAEGNLTEVVGPAGRRWQFTYDSEHRMLTMREPRYYGDTTTKPTPVVTNTFDSNGRVVTQTDPLGRRTAYDYTSQPGSTVITDPEGHVTLDTYAAGELVSTTKAAGTPEAATWQYTYDPATLGVSRVVNPNGDVTNNSYDEAGNLLSTTNPVGDTTSYVYNALDEVTSETDPLGVPTIYEYDETGNLLSKSTPLNESERATTTYLYEGAPGAVTSIDGPDGNVTRYGYDANGDRTSVTNANGDVTTYAYDEDSELTARTAPNGEAKGEATAYTTRYAYDAGGELTSETNPLGEKTAYTYDENGNRVTTTDPEGNVTRQSYDADNELTQTIRADGSTMGTEWNADGRTAAQIDGAGHATTYAYDGRGDLLAVTDPDGHATRYEYDPAARRVALIDAEGARTNYVYDAAGELRDVSYSDGRTHSVSESYDADGDRVSMSDGSGTSTYTYDALRRLVTAEEGSHATVRYGYDLAGRLTGITYPNGKLVSRAYDPSGNLTSVHDWLGGTTRFGYDAESNPNSEEYPNGVTASTGYDRNNRPATIADASAAGQLASFSYTRDGDGNLVGEHSNNGAETSTSFGHDPLQRLDSEAGTAYGYDAADNPTSYDGGTQSFDAANQLASSTSPRPEAELPTEAGEGKEPPAEGGEYTERTGEAPGTGTGGGAVTGSSTTGSTVGGAGGLQAFMGHHTPAIALDATVSGKRRGRGANLSSPTLRALGDHDLVLAFVSAGRTASRQQRVKRVVGGGLRWSLLARASDQGGDTEVWQAHAVGPLSAAFTATLAGGGCQANITVAAFAGSTPYAVAHAVGHGHKSVPSVRLSAPAGSLVWTVGRSVGRSAPVVPAGGERIVFQALGRRERTDGWVQRTTSASSISRVADHLSMARWDLVTVAVSEAPLAGSARARGRASRQGVAAGESASGEPFVAAGGPTSTDASAPGAAPRVSVPEARSFAYDARGDRTEESMTAGGAQGLSYDQAGQLVGVGSSIRYSYDGDGLRVSKTVGAVTTGYAWDRAAPVPRLLQNGSTYYIYGVAGRPLEQITSESPGYLLADAKGSTRLLTGGAGEVRARYDYDAWGRLTSHGGSASTSLQFDGQFRDPETGFEYLDARYFDPSTGQFLSRDPAQALTRSRYGYAADDPTDYSDPSGLWAIGVCVGAEGTAAPGVDFNASGELCTWEGGNGLWPSWGATTFTVTGGVGVGVGAGVGVDVGGHVDFAAKSPEDLAGPGCDVGGSVQAIAGVSASVGCQLDSIGLSFEFGAKAEASGSIDVGATDVLWASNGYHGWGSASGPASTEPLCNDEAYDPYADIA